MPAIRANIRELRDAKAMTQEDLAEKADIDVRTVQRLEAGESKSHATIFRVARALGVDVSALLRPSAPEVEDCDLQLHLDALAIHEIRRVGELLSLTPNAEAVSGLIRYADRYYSNRVRAEVLEAVASAVEKTRYGIDLESLRRCASVITAAMPLDRRPHRVPTSPEDGELLRTGAELGCDIAYDAAKFLKDLRVVEIGGDVLHAVMRHARVQNDGQLRAEVHDLFEKAREAALRGKSPFPDAIRWLTFEEQDALALDGDVLPKLPDDLFDKLNPDVAELRKHLRTPSKTPHRRRKGRKAK